MENRICVAIPTARLRKQTILKWVAMAKLAVRFVVRAAVFEAVSPFLSDRRFREFPEAPKTG